MRRAVIEISNGADHSTVAKLARSSFLEVCRSPGLAVENVDTYTLAQDYCAAITNILQYLSAIPLLSVRRPEPVHIADDLEWEFLSYADDSGLLHRWIFADVWDSDRFSSELHSWYTFGDMAASEMPMQLHVVEIGRRRESHLVSPWCRTYIHPVIAGRFKFTDLQGSQWKPLYFSDSHAESAEWIEQMKREGLTQKLVHHPMIREVKPEHVQQFRQQLISEWQDIQRAASIPTLELPMSRPSCDLPTPCIFREMCYR